MTTPYSDCVIAVTLERNTYIVQVPKSLEPVFRRTTDQLDNWFEECFADRETEKLQPGIYLCTIRTEPDPDIREEARKPEHVKIFVECIIPVNLFSNQALQLMFRPDIPKYTTGLTETTESLL